MTQPARRRAGLLAALASMLFLSLGAPLRAEVIVVDDSNAATGTPGGKSNPALAPVGWNNVIAAWVNTKSSGERRAYLSYHTIYGTQQGVPLAMGAPNGPTTGAGAESAASVGIADLTSLVLFSADSTTGGATARRNIFAQPISSSRTKTGLPKLVNQVIPGSQDGLLAALLANGRVLAVWQSHGASPASYDIRGRVLTATGNGVSPDRLLTKAAQGGHVATALAPEGSGAVLAYYVRIGKAQKVYLQRLDASGERKGNPILLKSTSGAKTYGGAGVAGRNSGGGFLAVWFTPAAGGKASLKLRFFNASGATGKTVTVDTVSILPGAQNAPRVLETDEGIVIVAGLRASGKNALHAWLLDDKGKPLDDKQLVASNSPIALDSLAAIPVTDVYFAGYTQQGSSTKQDKALLQGFHVETGCSVKC